MTELTIESVALMFGKPVAGLGKRSVCPIRKHKRADKSFTMFRSSTGTALWKCHSCDAPNNVGDAVKLYALLGGMDRKNAWLELREKGYDVPGARERVDRTPSRPARRASMSVVGRRPENTPVLPMPNERWDELRLQRLGAVEKFAKARGLDAHLLRELDVVDVDYDVVGFGYRDPATGTPCRVKARAIERKTFWIEPRAKEGETGVALSPLYLADRIETPAGLLGVVVVVEGEVDALTLKHVGIKNVVSLPDGCGSASKVDLRPLWYRSSMILSAVDADAEGDKAHRDLFARCKAMQKEIGRVRWERSDGTAFKDANEALLAGWGKDDFMACLQRVANEMRGFEVNLASAC